MVLILLFCNRCHDLPQPDECFWLWFQLWRPWKNLLFEFLTTVITIPGHCHLHLWWCAETQRVVNSFVFHSGTYSPGKQTFLRLLYVSGDRLKITQIDIESILWSNSCICILIKRILHVRSKILVLSHWVIKTRRAHLRSIKTKWKIICFLTTKSPPDIYRGSTSKLLSMYSDYPRGKPIVCPMLLCNGIPLQAYEQESDASAVLESMFDQRWQMVLGVSRNRTAYFFREYFVISDTV